ncbi:hypothetical protein BJ912DRAFT_47496 [Pholiota molesta]|nr:hypothetical protein BJ912DRAFT_47496 [Pholiota molesta]
MKKCRPFISYPVEISSIAASPFWIIDLLALCFRSPFLQSAHLVFYSTSRNHCPFMSLWICFSFLPINLYQYQSMHLFTYQNTYLDHGNGPLPAVACTVKLRLREFQLAHVLSMLASLWPCWLASPKHHER